MRRNGFWSVLLVLALISGCGKSNSGSGTTGTQPGGGGGGGTPPSGTRPPPESHPGSETFDLLDASFQDTSGWKIDTSSSGRESASPSAEGLELSVTSVFLEGDPSRCLNSTVTLKRPGLLKDLTEATLELQVNAQSLPKDTEYWLRMEAEIDPGKRLFNFTPHGIRTYTPEASKKVSDTVLTPGAHTARLVVKGELTALYLDGKKLGSVDKGYLKGGAPGDVVIEFALPDKFPAAGPQDCPSTPAKVQLKKLRIASKAYFPS